MWNSLNHSQILSNLSFPPEAHFEPSGLQSTVYTSSKCSGKSLMSIDLNSDDFFRDFPLEQFLFAFKKFQIFTVESELALIRNLESGDHTIR